MRMLVQGAPVAEAGYLYFLDALLFSGIHLLLHSLATKQGLQCGALRGEAIFLQGQLYFWKNKHRRSGQAPRSQRF